MINILPTNTDFLYVLKKAINLYLFKDPGVISDIIDILDKELSNTLGSDAITTFKFQDGEYTITFIVDESLYDDTMHDRIQSIIINVAMEFCIRYETEIKDALIDMGNKAEAETFEDCIISHQGNILSGIMHKTEFNSSDGYTVILRMY